MKVRLRTDSGDSNGKTAVRAQETARERLLAYGFLDFRPMWVPPKVSTEVGKHHGSGSADRDFLGFDNTHDKGAPARFPRLDPPYTRLGPHRNCA